MPTIYLSPSTQEFNPYSGGGDDTHGNTPRWKNEFFIFQHVTAVISMGWDCGIYISVVK